MHTVPDPGVVTPRPAGVTVYRHVEVLPRPAARHPEIGAVIAALTAAAGALHDSDRRSLREAPDPVTTAGHVRADAGAAR
ncbi:hypothetical protein FHR93_002798 [Geodermatophilus sabuli]|uniref:Uncharacterized protein n=1 Tax=Geodermatophilus sabuli TaxID=1564158 RepID=A0A285EDK5_9ACTN|nr:hypothetical protein [Geodermatophilus sabuli]SNX97222.1 hypothetical protein SAMN06893097_106172 [Geodermatophilus sabuli]